MCQQLPELFNNTFRHYIFHAKIIAAARQLRMVMHAGGAGNFVIMIYMPVLVAGRNFYITGRVGWPPYRNCWQAQLTGNVQGAAVDSHHANPFIGNKAVIGFKVKHPGNIEQLSLLFP